MIKQIYGLSNIPEDRSCVSYRVADRSRQDRDRGTGGVRELVVTLQATLNKRVIFHWKSKQKQSLSYQKT